MKTNNNKEVTVDIEEKVQATVMEALDNSKEKEEKEKNVIFFNVPEVDEQLEKKDENKKKEEEFLTINGIMKEAEKDHFTPLLNKSNVQRIGQRRPGSIRPRPIIVKLASTEAKWFLLRNARHLKESTIKWGIQKS